MSGGPRRHARRLVIGGCQVTAGEERLSGIALDVSEEGLSTLLPKPIELGRRAEVQLSLGSERITGEAVVSWRRTEPEGVRTGLRWARLGELERERLRAACADARPAVLVVDEEPEERHSYEALSDSFRVLWARHPDEAIRLLERGDIAALVVTDQALGGRSLQFLTRLSEQLPQVRTSRIIVLEHTVAGELAHWVNEGRVFSCVRKPFDAAHLRQVCQRAVDRFSLAMRHAQLVRELAAANERLEQENALLRRRFVAIEGFEGIVGQSPQLREALREVARYQGSDVAVHLTGETGTGKELVARALHQGGARAGGPFVAINCAGISENLLQSILFGHRRGAFTGADRDHAGVFEQAQGGTLLLDEIAELPPVVQASLLRTLQEREVWPLGARAPVKVNVRVISATHKELREEVRAGRFREDLFYRLVVVATRLPPLRERTGDVAILARHFLELECEAKGRDVRGFTSEAMLALERYRWPGNVRELENEIERLVLIAPPQGLIGIELLSPQVRGEGPRPKVAQPEDGEIAVPLGLGYEEAVLRLVRELVQRALRDAEGNVAQAARRLQMDRTRLVKLRSRIGI